MESVPGIAIVGTVAVAVVTAVAILVVARVQKARLQKKVRLEITNAGNVKSRYNLRAEELQGALRFRFILDGDSLPVHTAAAAGRSTAGQPAPARTAARGRDKTGSQGKAGGARQKADGVMQTSNALASLLNLVGSLLPRSMGIPLQQKASQMRRVQSRASYAQQLPNQMAWFKSSASRVVPGAGQAQERPVPRDEAPVGPSGGDDADAGFTWSQTPYVQPGKTLAVDLIVRSVLATGNQTYTYEIVSRSADQTAAPPVTAEGQVRIRGGFWARRFLPYVLVALAAVALLILIYWPLLA
jgi:hypothetical protein